MKQTILLIIKGFIIGVAKIIPGVSGAVLAISMGIYERAILAISDFRKDIKNNLLFLIPLGIGAVLAIIISSKLVLYLLDNYFLPTMLLFVGLIGGGMNGLFKKVKFKETKSVAIFIVCFSLVCLLSLIGGQNFFASYSNNITGFLLFFGMGIVDALTMVVPGISGTAIMMILGCYHLLLETLGNLTSISNIIANLGIIIPFGIGLLIGVWSLAKIMKYLLSQKEKPTYAAIAGFACGSLILLLISTFKNNYSILEIVISLILLVLGYFVALKLNKD